MAEASKIETILSIDKGDHDSEGGSGSADHKEVVWNGTSLLDQPWMRT